MKKRVVITGLGTINSVGLDAKSAWENLKVGKLGISKLDEDIIERTGVKFAGKIVDYDPLQYFSKKEVRRMDLCSQFALVAAKEAAKDAKLENIENRERIGCNITSGIGGLITIQNNVETAVAKGYKKVSPMFIPNAIINLVAGNVAIDLDCKGICTPIVTACASSTDAIGHAMMYIQSGAVDVMVTGGSEAAIKESGLAGFQNMGALSKAENVEEASIPFDENRSGFVMGEGSGVLVLEEYEHAKKRGATIYGEVVGYSNTCDAMHITAPDEEAIQGQRAVRQAMEQAKVTPKDVKYVNAHGTSTPLNDKGEIKLLKKIYGDDFESVNITSSKSMTGHVLGGTGAIEAYITAMSLQEQLITPTINTKELDQDCNGNICLEKTKEIETEYGMSVSLGFGGHNSVIILKRVKGE